MSEKEIGRISHYFGKISVGIIELTDSLNVGDTIHIKGIHDDFTQNVDSLQVEHVQIVDAVGVKVASKVHENDKVFKVIE